MKSLFPKKHLITRRHGTLQATSSCFTVENNRIVYRG